jgi:hypothetical protein
LLPSPALACAHRHSQVLRSYERANVARTNRYNLTLLDQAVGDGNREAFRKLILELQARKRDEHAVLSGGSKQRTPDRIKKVEGRLMSMYGGKSDVDELPSKMLLSGHDALTEPYLQLQLKKLLEDSFRSLQKGKLVWPGASGSDESSSPLLVGVPDPTGSLKFGEVAPYVGGDQVPRPASIGVDEPFHALAYRDPGMSAGDIRRVQIKYTRALAELMLQFSEGASLNRVNVVFFSVQGDPRHDHRSLADMLAGGDYDGDEYQIIVWQDLVRRVVNESPPYHKDAPLPKLVPLRQGGKGKARAAATPSAAAAAPRPHAQRQQQAPCQCDLCSLTKRHTEKKRNAEAAKAQEAAAAAAAAEDAAAGRAVCATPLTGEERRAAAKAAQDAAAAARTSRGKQAQQVQVAALQREAAEKAARLAKEAATTEALISNYLMARFLGSAMVGSSATHWMIFADKLANEGGCCHPICLHLAHEYLQALDAEGRERLELGFHRRLPPSLRSSVFPAFMRDDYVKRRALSSKGGDGKAKQVELLPSTNSLLGQLWQLDLTVESEGRGVKLDRQLCTREWKPDEFHDVEADKRKMTELYACYAKNVSKRVEEGYNDEDWTHFRELIKECKEQLLEGLTDYERRKVPPAWLYARVAALYEVCYRIAEKRQQQGSQESPSSAGNASTESANSASDGTPSFSVDASDADRSVEAPLKFPWRIAAKYLNEMKARAKEYSGS